MPAYQYYAEERERWAALLPKGGKIGAEEAELGIRTLATHFGLSLKHVDIRFTQGRRWSKGGYNTIVINLDGASWLLIAHEVAHCYQQRKLKRPRRWHSKAHRRITDRFCAWILTQGWMEGALAHEVALEGLQREARATEERRLAAEPPPIDQRITHRQAQVKRLETKIRMLTTRLKTAKRSLAALERVAAKQERTEP